MEMRARNSIWYRDAYREAYSEAFREAYKEGFKIGVRKGAIGMLKQHLPLEVIHEVTELPLYTIKKLAEENNIPVQSKVDV